MVSRTISLKFLVPVLSVRAGATIALRTPVPKTAVHEDADMHFAENEVWLTEQLLLSPPTNDSMRPECLNQAQLCRFVAVRTDNAHHLRPLALVPNIRHQE